MRNWTKIILSSLAMLVFGLGFAQNVTVSGIVTDEFGPAPDVMVTAEKSGATTNTDQSGFYEIEVAPDDTLEFMSVMGVMETVQVDNRSEINLTFGQAISLSNVVAIGYGTQEKIDVTGAIAVISAEDLENKPNPNAMSSIQGKVAGVTILNSGAPGGNPTVSIRGIQSLAGSVLYVVDGVFTSDISYLSSNDIEAMSILKDPSSKAIYGVKANMGVVVITTKSGKKGKPRIDVNTYSGFKVLTKMPHMVNRDQYIELYNEKLLNQGETSGFISAVNYPANTDWFDEIFKTGFINENNVSIAGADDKFNYLLSLGYLYDQGILDAGRVVNSGNDFKKFTTRANVTYQATDRLKVGSNITWYEYKTNNANAPFTDAALAPPVNPIYDAQGEYGISTIVNIGNPRAALDLNRGKSKGDRFIFNLFGEYEILDDLTFRLSGSRDIYTNNSYGYTHAAVKNGVWDYTENSLNKSTGTGRNYLLDGILTWDKNFGKHDLTTLLGSSVEENSNFSNSAFGRYIPYNYTDASLYLGNVDDVTYSDGGSKTRYRSFFGRVNYSFDKKYLFNASLRNDGTSDYDSENRTKWFPSVGLGWVVSKESFMDNVEFINLLKFTGSWGILGNANLPRDYDNTVSNTGGVYFGGIGYPSFNQTTIRDNNIKWEKTEGINIGMELEAFSRKLNFEVAYYNDKSKDVAYYIVQPSISGATNALFTNAYDFKNQGFEFTLNWKNQINDNFSYNVYANLTTIDNEITNVLGGSYLNTGPDLFGHTITRLEAGQSIGSYYGFQVDGIFQNQQEVDDAPTQSGATIGGFRFADTNGDGRIDDSDKTFLGSPIPDFNYGFGLGLNAYNFDFAIDFMGVQGNELYNYNRNQRFGNETWDYDFYVNHWSETNPSNTYPLVTNDQQILKTNSFYVEDGSFFRIRNIQIGYSVSEKFLSSLNMQKLRVYVSAQNPFTSFDYNGFSPEISTGNRLQQGVDRSIYPLTATYSLGLNLTF